MSPIINLREIFNRSRANNSEVNDLTWPNFQVVRDFIPLLDACKFEESVITTESAMPRSMSNVRFLSLKGN